jgi:hypothetical protein
MFDKLLRQLLPSHYSQTEDCIACGKKGIAKQTMVHRIPYGWFCNEEEFDKFWTKHQW